jgi:hypothetical protein
MPPSHEKRRLLCDTAGRVTYWQRLVHPFCTARRRQRTWGCIWKNPPQIRAEDEYLNKYLRLIPIEFRKAGCCMACAAIDAWFSSCIKADSWRSKNAVHDSNSITKTGVKTIQSRFRL